MCASVCGKRYGVLVTSAPGDWEVTPVSESAPYASPEARSALRLVLENTSDVVWLYGPDGVCEWVSPSVQSLLGFEPAALIGTRTSLVHPDDREAVLLTIQRAMDRRETHVRTRARVLAANGTTRWVDSAIDMWWSSDGRLLRQTASMRDITEQVEAEQALAVSEAHYRLLADQVSDVVVQGDSSGIIRWVSPSVTAALGWQPSDLEGHPFWSWTHPDDMAAARLARQQVEGGSSVSVKVRLRQRRGAYRWFDIRVDPWRDADGTVIGRLARWRDVHAEVEAQRAEREASQRLASVVESSRLGTWDWNMVTGEVVFNEQWARIVGYELADLGPVSIDTWIELAHPEDLAASDDLIAAHVRGDTEFYELQCRMRHRDGHWVWVLDRGRIVEWAPDGQPLRMTGTHEDISARKQAERDLADSEQRYRTLVHRMADVVISTDVEGTILFVGPSIIDLLGWIPDELVGLTWPELVHPDDTRPYTRADQVPAMVRVRLQSKDGSYRWVESAQQVQHGPDGVVTGLICVWRDATDAVHREQATMAESEELYAVTDNVGDVVFRVHDGAVMWASPSATDQLGGAPDQWIGVHLVDRVHPQDADAFALEEIRVLDGVRRRFRIRIRDLNGSYRWVDAVASPAADGYVVSLRVIDDDVARETALQRLAGSDSLTGLPNRRELRHRLGVLLADRGQGAHTGVLFCDVDNLKMINDAHGHAAGDAVLTTIADRIQQAIRRDDVAARVGGDELVVVLSKVDTLQQVADLADTIRAAVEAPMGSPDGLHIQATISIGATWAHPGEDPDTLLARADDAMYRAKQAGRNRLAIAE